MRAMTIHISQDGHYAGTGRLVRHYDGTVTIEDCWAILGPRGLDHASGAQQAAAERAYDAIERAIARGESTVTVDGCVYSWAIEEPPEIRVLGLGDEDWDAEPKWERYGTVRVRIGEVDYEVGVAIGVPEYLRATAQAAGGDTTRPAYLAAWYVDQSDWSFARGSDGTVGLPADLAPEVLGAISSEVARLWREYQQQLTEAES